MESIIAKLVNIAEALDSQGETLLADSVDKTANSVLLIKQAQYVGSQGYWIRNSRCWGNCYRQKRASSPSKPAQEVWMDCWQEYQKSIDDAESWSKYADTNDQTFIKTAQETFPEAERFSIKVSSLIKSGQPIANAVVAAIEEERTAEYNILINAANNLADLSQKIVSKDKKIASDLSDVAGDLIKEAGWWDNVSNIGKNVGRGIGQNVGGLLGGAVGGAAGGLAGGFRNSYDKARWGPDKNVDPKSIAQRLETVFGDQKWDMDSLNAAFNWLQSKSQAPQSQKSPVAPAAAQPKPVSTPQTPKPTSQPTGMVGAGMPNPKGGLYSEPAAPKTPSWEPTSNIVSPQNPPRTKKDTTNRRNPAYGIR